MAVSISTVNDLERRALELEEADRLRLAQSLLHSLHARPGSVDPVWFEEAAARDAELGDDPDQGLSLADVLDQARQALR